MLKTELKGYMKKKIRVLSRGPRQSPLFVGRVCNFLNCNTKPFYSRPMCSAAWNGCESVQTLQARFCQWRETALVVGLCSRCLLLALQTRTPRITSVRARVSNPAPAAQVVLFVCDFSARGRGIIRRGLRQRNSTTVD